VLPDATGWNNAEMEEEQRQIIPTWIRLLHGSTRPTLANYRSKPKHQVAHPFLLQERLTEEAGNNGQRLGW
jgi:hypothetical protein